MAKRKAAADLNHDNWDREEEPETAGTFKEAPQDVVLKRVIRTGRRRLQATAASNSTLTGSNTPESKKLFSGFTGFTTKNSFSFLNKSDTPLQMKSIHGNLKKSDTPLKVNSTKGDGNCNGDSHQEYLAKVRGLNEAVLAWVKQHVEDNPCCILTPVFRDYDDFLKEIQSEKEKANSSNKGSESSECSSKITNPILSSIAPTSITDSKSFSPLLPSSKKEGWSEAGTPSFNKDPKLEKASSPVSNKGSADKPAESLFGFGSKNTSTFDFNFGASKEQAKQFSFGAAVKQPSSDSDAGAPPHKKSFFNFASSSTDKPSLVNFPSSVLPGTGFFKDISKAGGESRENDNGDDEDEPKPEPVNPVTEDDAVFTQRVKVFVKKGDGYSDLGVGNLFIKEAPNGWHQALVRNETSLGNIIFNILLSEQQPTKRVGKNNVMMVCQPTPQHTGPALPVLLRVKTSEEADKLLETLDKYKKK